MILGSLFLYLCLKSARRGRRQEDVDAARERGAARDCFSRPGVPPRAILFHWGKVFVPPRAILFHWCKVFVPPRANAWQGYHAPDNQSR